MIHGLAPRLAEAGKIKIGGLGKEMTSAKGKKFRPPLKFDHFIVTKTTRDANGDLELDAALMAALPKDKKDGKIREIPIYLHSDVIEEVFPHNLAMYAGKKIGCRGDSKTARRFVDIKTGARFKEPEPVMCPCPLLGASGNYTCKPHGNLHVSIAAGGLAVAGAVHILRTTSIITIQRMVASLEQIISLTGTLKGIPLTLKVTPQRVEPANAPASTVYVCHVELRASDVLKVQQHALQMAEARRALGGNFSLEYRNVVKPPADERETPEEQAEAAAEFHPEDPANVETGKDDTPLEMPRRKTVDAVKVEEPTKQEPKAGTYQGPITGGKSEPTKKNPIYHLYGNDPEVDHFTTFSKTAWELAKECKGTGEDVVIEWKETQYGKDAVSVKRASDVDAPKEPGEDGPGE